VCKPARRTSYSPYTFQPALANCVEGVRLAHVFLWEDSYKRKSWPDFWANLVPSHFCVDRRPGRELVHDPARERRLQAASAEQRDAVQCAWPRPPCHVWRLRGTAY
jgi:hypothetical protein